MDERGLFFERKIKRAYLIAVLRQAMEREREEKKKGSSSLSLSPSFVFFTWLGTISHA